MRISDVMTREAVWCTPACTAAQAATLMRDCHCGALPVVRSHANQKVVGIVTDRDLCIKVVAEKQHPADVLVDECMTLTPICCNREDDVTKALAMMAEHRVRRVIVVDHDKHLQGIISLTDLLEYGVATPEEVAKLLTPVESSEKRAAAAAAG
jgi:signal-transduction protein with cAMP-binding, CBS, and nucleotidyltransferase domain